MYRRERYAEVGINVLRLWYAAKGRRSVEVRTPDRFVDPPFTWKGRRRVPEDGTSIVLPGGGSPIFFEPNDRYKVFVSTNWLTNRWYSAKSGTSFTIDFSVPAPANAWVDYAVLNFTVATIPRQGIENLSEDDTSVTITVSELDTDYKFLGTPSWNTGWYYDDSTKTRTAITVYFEVPAPAAATFDWVAPA